MDSNTPFLPSLRACLAPMGGRCARFTRSIRQATLGQIEQRLSKAVNPSLLNQNSAGAYSRERVFTLARTFWCWIWQVLQANTSCREVVRQVQALFAIHGRGLDESTAAYCQARGKLSLGLLQKVFAGSARPVEQRAPASVLLGGRPIRLVDGSGMRLADTPENRAAFPPPKNQPKGTGFPYLKVVVLFSLQSGAVPAHSIGSLLHHELRLFLCLRRWLKKDEVLVMDRAYGVYLVAAVLQGLGVDLVARLSNLRKVNFRKAYKRLGPSDALFIWNKPAKASPILPRAQWMVLPSQLTARILRQRVHRPGFRVRQLTVVTTLLDPELYPAQEILQAYLQRWRMEMCLEDLKTTLQMEQLSCQSPKMVHKELLVFLTAPNFLRWIMAEAAQDHQVDLQRLSFKGCLDGFRQFNQALSQLDRGKNGAQKREKLWRRFLQTLCRDLVLARPGRREPRAVKRRQKYRLAQQTPPSLERPTRPSRACRARSQSKSTRRSCNLN